jgi:hypothetical protein
MERLKAIKEMFGWFVANIYDKFMFFRVIRHSFLNDIPRNSDLQILYIFSSESNAKKQAFDQDSRDSKNVRAIFKSLVMTSY